MGPAAAFDVNGSRYATDSGSSGSGGGPSKKAQLLAAQLSTARQRALDASRMASNPANLAVYSAGSLGGFNPSASFGGAYSSPGLSDTWISPAPGDAFVAGMDVVLTW